MAGEAWTPEALETVRFGMANGKTAQELADQLGRTRKAVRSAAKSNNLGEWVYRRAGLGRNVPDDFEQRLAEIGTLRGVARHYGKSDSTIVRWVQLRGLTYPPPIRTPKPEKHKPIKRGVSEFMGQPRRPAIIGEPIRDMSTAGRAADFLRRYGPVFRRGDHWFRGSTRLSDAELIQRAIWRGWVL